MRLIRYGERVVGNKRVPDYVVYGTHIQMRLCLARAAREKPNWFDRLREWYELRTLEAK